MTLHEHPHEPHGAEDLSPSVVENEAWLRARLGQADKGLTNVESLKLRAQIAASEAWFARALKDRVPSGLADRIKTRLHRELPVLQPKHRPELRRGMHGRTRTPGWHLVYWSGGAVAAAATIGIWFAAGVPTGEADLANSGAMVYVMMAEAVEQDPLDVEVADLLDDIESLELALQQDTNAAWDDRPGADLMQVLDEMADDANPEPDREL